MKSQKTTNMYNYCKDAAPNYMVTAVNSNLINIRNQNLKEALAKFEGANHKLELVKTIRGVRFVDDAAASNTHAVWYALESAEERPSTVWITNMSDIETIHDALLEVIGKKVKSIVIQGNYNSEIIDFFSGIGKEISYAVHLEDAVRTAFYSCEQGDEVLYSPGAPCDETYSSYKTRGEKFQEAVAQL